MRKTWPSYWVMFLLVAAAHSIAVTALYWPQINYLFADLAGWAFAYLATAEPTPNRSPLHPDVTAAEKTALGRKLLYREGWMVTRPLAGIAWSLVVTALSVVVYIALSPAAETPEECLQIALFAPVVMMAAGFVVSGMVNMWVVTGPLIGLWVLSLVACLLQREWLLFARFAAGALGVLGCLWMGDLQRGVRRGLEPKGPK